VTEASKQQVVKVRNRNTSLWLVLVVAGMFGFGYALIPLYNVFCEIAGINGKGIPIDTENTAMVVDENREITVEFTGSIMGSLPWDFDPATKVTVHPGETVRITYTAKNLSSSDVTGKAVPSITPNKATRYFIKTECFCFQNQTLAAGEQKEMPLVFKVDTDIPDTVKTITLSYAFFRAEQNESSS